MEKTPIQWQIEKVVTNDLGYSEKREGLDSEFELQDHLDFLNLMIYQTERGFTYIGDEPETQKFFRRYANLRQDLFGFY